jgi:hypothetical protein
MQSGIASGLGKAGFYGSHFCKEQHKGKKEIRASKTSKSKILFDYINFVFYEGNWAKQHSELLGLLWVNLNCFSGI